LITPAAFAKNNPDRARRKVPATRGKRVKVVTFVKKQAIFAQGDRAGTVFYIQKGRVRLTVVSKFGREVTLSIVSEGEFFGDGGLAGQPLRKGSANAVVDCELLQIDKKTMSLALRRERSFSELYVAYLLARNIQYHEALVDQLFDPCEKRIARVLLLLADFGKEGTFKTVIPKVNRETLADMAGTTPLRVSFFMNKFRRSGFLAVSKDELQIHRSLLNVVLRD